VPEEVGTNIPIKARTGGNGISCLGLILVGALLFFTNPGNDSLAWGFYRNQVKQHGAFGMGQLWTGLAFGMERLEYHNYLICSTLDLTSVDGAERTVQFGFLGFATNFHALSFVFGKNLNSEYLPNHFQEPATSRQKNTLPWENQNSEESQQEVAHETSEYKADNTPEKAPIAKDTALSPVDSSSVTPVDSSSENQH